MTLGSTLIYQFSPPSYRGTGSTLFCVGFGMGAIIANVWGLADNKENLWKYAALFQIIPCLIMCVLSFTYFKDYESPVQLLQNGKRDLAVNFMKHYIKQDFMIYTLDNFQENIDKENLFFKANVGVRFALIKNYSKEFIYVLLLA